MLYASSLKKCNRALPECATTSGTRRTEKFWRYMRPLEEEETDDIRGLRHFSDKNVVVT